MVKQVPQHFRNAHSPNYSFLAYFFLGFALKRPTKNIMKPIIPKIKPSGRDIYISQSQAPLPVASFITSLPPKIPTTRATTRGVNPKIVQPIIDHNPNFMSLLNTIALSSPSSARVTTAALLYPSEAPTLFSRFVLLGKVASFASCPRIRVLVLSS